MAQSFMQSAQDQYPEDEGRASARHWNEVIRFEDSQYRQQWLSAEQARFKLIFLDESEYDRYCAAFIEHRIAV